MFNERIVISKANSGGLMGHFGVKKTLEMLSEHFYWSKKKIDVESGL